MTYRERREARAARLQGWAQSGALPIMMTAHYAEFTMLKGKGGGRVTVVASHVLYVIDQGTHSTIVTASGTGLSVQEPYQYVLTALF